MADGLRLYFLHVISSMQVNKQVIEQRISFHHLCSVSRWSCVWVSEAREGECHSGVVLEGKKARMASCEEQEGGS